MSDLSESVSTTNENDVKIKKERTPLQLETLKRAREKAAKVRTENAIARQKQKEIDRNAAETVKKQKSEKLEREYAALYTENKEKVEPLAKEEEEEEEVEYVYKKKPTKKKENCRSRKV